MKKLSVFSYVVLFAIFTSCSALLSKKYGIEYLDSFDEKKYKEVVESIDFKNIPYYSTYQDSTAYEKIRNLSLSQIQKKDMSQPVQIYYFEDDSLVSFQANCYAKGKGGNLEWNTSNRFNTFPPVSAIDLDSFPIEKKSLLQSVKRVDTQNKSKYTVFIYWTRMFGKISESAVRTVIDNIETHSQQEQTIIYLINNDDYFAKSY